MPVLLKNNRKILCTIVLYLVVSNAYTQNLEEDFTLINNSPTFHIEKRKVEYLFAHEKSFIKKYNPVSLLLGSSLYIYQKYISPQLSGSCLYQPSCSSFSMQAIRTFGLLKGTLVTADRLMRCNQLAALDIFVLNLDKHTHKVVEHPDRYRLKGLYP